MDKELEAKEKIIQALKDFKKVFKKLGMEDKFNDSFKRGFIQGGECMLNVKLPCHWFDEILKEVDKE